MSIKLALPPKAELLDLYESMSISQLAKHYATSRPTVKSWMAEYDITKRDQKTAAILSNTKKRLNIPGKETFQKLYLANTEKDLQHIYNVGQETIHHWIEVLDIQKRSLGEAVKFAKERAWNNRIPTKEELTTVYDDYRHLGLTANHFGLCSSSIRKLLTEYEIPTHIPWRSVGEQQILEFCQQIRPDLTWIANDKRLINPYELDIVCHELKLAIEYCGIYWHSEISGTKSSTYHQKKMLACKDKGYQLITIYESDDLDQMKSILSVKLGLATKVHARKTRVSKISPEEYRAFNLAHHRQKHTPASVYLGLYHEGELTQTISFAKPRYNKAFDWECIRMTTKSGIVVVGGASKLWKHFMVGWPGSIITYADARFGSGEIYEKCGLVFSGLTNPNYKYFHTKNRMELKSRQQFQKHKLASLPIFDQTMTEWEIMKANGYDRIWDCGNFIYMTR